MSNKTELLRKRLGSRKTTRQMYASHRSEQPVELANLRLDGGTQPRERFDEDILKEYAEKMSVDDRDMVIDSQGQPWEPIVVYDDGDDLWLADGFHRVRAARTLDISSFQARIIIGSQRDAVKFSLSANARHGLRRTNADKRRAVERAIQDDEWGALSARAIADICSVSDFMVRQVRSSLEEAGEVEVLTTRMGADGKVHDVSTRQQPATKKPSSTKKKKKALASLEHPNKLAKSLDAHVVALDELDSTSNTKKVDCIIAYADSAIHFDALLDHLPRLLKKQGTLLIPLKQGRQALLGPSRLDQLVQTKKLAHPRWIAIQKTRSVLLAWAPPAQELPSWTSQVDDIIDIIEPKSTLVLVQNTSN